MAKKTNRQVVRKTRQVRATSAAKGSAEYSSITSAGQGGFDIKKLMTSVAAANNKKKGAVNKVRTLSQVAAVEEQKVVVEETEALEEQAKELETHIEDLKKRKAELKALSKATGEDESVAEAIEAVRIFGVVVDTKTRAKRLTPSSFEEVEKYKYRAKIAILSLPAGSDTRLTLFSKYAAIVRKAATLTNTPPQDEEVPQVSDEPTDDAPKRKDPRERLLGKKPQADENKGTLAKVRELLGLVRNPLSRGADDEGPARANVSPMGASVKALAISGAGRVGQGLTALGQSVKKNGKDTLKWISGKLHALTRGILGMFRNTKNMLTSNGPGDWAAMAAIGVGILPHIVQGLVDELKARFGENFITEFITKKWEDTKAFVRKWVDEFIDGAFTFIKALPDTIVKWAEKAWDLVKTLAGTAKEAVRNFFFGDDDDKSGGTPASSSVSSVTPTDRLAGLVLSHQQAKNPGEKTEIENKIKTLVEASPSLYNDSRIIANLEKRGIYITAKSTTQNTSTGTAYKPSVSFTPSTAGAGRGSAQSVGVAPDAPVSGGGGNATVVTPPTPAAEPVVATPPAPAPAPSSDAGGDTLSKGGSISGGLNNASVPDNAAPDTLFFMNLSSMGTN